MKKVIITVVGVDTVGIIAGISAYLARNKVNILDISQTVVGGFFNMMMVVDTGDIKSFDVLSRELEQLGEEIGVVIKCQNEEIFNRMHRI
jgi:ACT domain-containing protein